MRMTFWVAPRRGLEQLASATLREVADRCGWTLQARDTAGEPTLVVAPTGLVFWEEPRRGIPLSRLPESRVRELTSKPVRDITEIFHALEGKPWPGLRVAHRGDRRWWVGALAHTAERQGMRDALRADLEHLTRLAVIAPVGLPWYDALAKEVGSIEPSSGPIFGAPNGGDGLLVVELEPARLGVLLDWARTIEQFAVQPGTPNADQIEPREWHAYVAGHVRLLGAVQPDEIVVVSMS